MRISVLITGILVIIGAVIEHAVIPQILGNINTLTNHIVTSVLPMMSNTEVNSAYASSLTDINSKVLQLNSGMGMIEKISEYSFWATLISGIGTMAFGAFAKNNRNKKNQALAHNSTAYDILKMRLAKGEITRKEFNKLKNYV